MVIFFFANSADVFHCEKVFRKTKKKTKKKKKKQKKQKKKKKKTFDLGETDHSISAYFNLSL